MNVSRRVGTRMAKRRVWHKFLVFLQWTTLAAWLGSMLFLSFIAAPSAFRVLQDTRVAGDLVGTMLERLYLVSYVLGAVLIATTMIQGTIGQVSMARVWTMVAALVILIGFNVYSREILSTQMKSLRQSLGQIEQVPPHDPRRLAFDQLHRRSVQLMGGSIVMALILTYLAIGTSNEPREVNKWRV